MEITLNVKLSASPELVEILNGIFSGNPVEKASPNEIERVGNTIVANNDVPKPKKEKAVKAEKVGEPKPSEKEPAKATVDLSTIRQFVAKSEANKTAARALFGTFEIKALTELPAERYEEFYAALTEANDL